MTKPVNPARPLCPTSAPPIHPAPRLGECFALALYAVEALATELETTGTGIPEHAEPLADLQQLTVAALTILKGAEKSLNRLGCVDLSPAPELESLEPTTPPEKSVKADPPAILPITGNAKTYYQVPPEALDEPVYAVQIVGIHNIPYMCLRQDFKLPEKVLRKALKLQKNEEKYGTFTGLFLSNAPAGDDNFFGICKHGEKWHSIRGKFSHSFETLDNAKTFASYVDNETVGYKTDWLLLQRVGGFIIPEKF